MQNIAIFKATLRLIKEGKFSLLSMAEIGYRARVSGTTVEAIFETREELVHALGEHIFDEINRIVSASLKSKASFDERFFFLWDALFTHYKENPEVISFLDYYKSIPLNVDEVRKLETKSKQLLTTFFENECGGGNVFRPATMALIFHENIRIAATRYTESNEPERKALARMVFRGFRPEQLSSLEAA